MTLLLSHQSVHSDRREHYVCTYSRTHHTLVPKGHGTLTAKGNSSDWLHSLVRLAVQICAWLTGRGKLHFTGMRSNIPDITIHHHLGTE